MPGDKYQLQITAHVGVTNRDVNVCRVEFVEQKGRAIVGDLREIFGIHVSNLSATLVTPDTCKLEFCALGDMVSLFPNVSLVESIDQ